MDTLQLLESRFPGALLVKPTDAGALLNQSRQSTYNQLCQGRFPIPTVTDHLGRRMVRLLDLAAYIDGMAVAQPLPPQPRKRDKPQGRPTKVEQVEAARRGITVPELRAQRNLVGV